jgi:hypothetical protein
VRVALFLDVYKSQIAASRLPPKEQLSLPEQAT